VPLLLFGDPEVDEGLVPDVAEAHGSREMVLGLPAVAEERRADADVRRALLDGDAVVLARAHRELPQAVLLRELAQPAEVRARRPTSSARRSGSPRRAPGSSAAPRPTRSRASGRARRSRSPSSPCGSAGGR